MFPNPGGIFGDGLPSRCAGWPRRCWPRCCCRACRRLHRRRGGAGARAVDESAQTSESSPSAETTHASRDAAAGGACAARARRPRRRAARHRDGRGPAPRRGDRPAPGHLAGVLRAPRTGSRPGSPRWAGRWSGSRSGHPAGSPSPDPPRACRSRPGRSVNVIATRGDVVPGEPWLAVGAHLDTVPTSPGAEDNASGIGALLAVAEAAAERRTRLPVVLIAFGAEEPRGRGDDDHQYGSRAYVASLTADERRVAARHGRDGPGRRRHGGPGRAAWRTATRCAPSCSGPPAGPAYRRSRSPASAPATTGPSCARGCRVSGSGARRTPATTPPTTSSRSSIPRQLARVARLVVSWLR